MCVLISHLPVLFHGPICLSFYHYYTALITKALYEAFKLDSVIPTTYILLFQMVLVILIPLPTI